MNIRFYHTISNWTDANENHPVKTEILSGELTLF